MLRYAFIGRLIVLLVCLYGCRNDICAQDTPAGRHVLVTRVEGQAINAIVARHIRRAIERAEEENAECLVIELDTPGGLVTSTREIVKDILASEVCIIVYVAPTGAEAASAGGFIVLAAHVAVMSPATTIGAMHPVSIGNLPLQTPARDEESSSEDPPAAQSASERKIVNNTAAWARGLANRHGRNAEWAEAAVNSSVVATEQEALDSRVIDLVATDIDDLLSQLQGRPIVVAGRNVTLNTENAAVVRIEMWWGDQILATISEPNVAFMLLLLGFYGILFEFYSPGWGVGGTVGIVSLLLAFFGLSVLPVNYTGLLLIGVGLGMLVAEVFVTSFGMLGLGGVICLAVGGLMLVESPVGFARISTSVVLSAAIATGLITVFLAGAIVQAQRREAVTGGDALISTEAMAVTDFAADSQGFRGIVRIRGETWNAVCTQPIKASSVVQVKARDGLTLQVDVVNAPDSTAQSTEPHGTTAEMVGTSEQSSAQEDSNPSTSESVST